MMSMMNEEYESGDQEMEEVKLALLDIYMERLTLNDEDENMVDADLVLVPPANVAESDEEEMEAENPVQIPESIPANPTSYPKLRMWTQPEEIDLQPFPEFVEPEEIDLSSFDPVQLFELFFDEDVYIHLHTESIAYAALSNNQDIHLCVKELKAFIGILLLSGYMDVPRWRMYWEAGTESFNSLVSSAMRRKRFEEIKRWFHLADNDNLKEGDKFAKVRPLFDMFNDRFRFFAPLEENLCVDESICPYFGRHSAKQFIRGKPIRFGFKSKVLGIVHSIGLFDCFQSLPRQR